MGTGAHFAEHIKTRFIKKNKDGLGLGKLA